MRRGWAGLNGVKTRSEEEGRRKEEVGPPPKPHLLPKVALAIPSSCVSHESFAAPPMSSLSSSSFFFLLLLYVNGRALYAVVDATMLNKADNSNN